MTKAVTKKQSSELQAKMAQDAAIGFEGDTSDILIPKLLIGQSTSKVVQDEQVSFGQIWRSTTGEAVGGKGEPVKFIPLSMHKNWVVFKKGSSRFEFCRVDKFTPGENLDWYFEEDGIQMKREQCLNFYGLLPSDIEADLSARENFAKTGELPDDDAGLFPCLLQFKSTSYKAGKAIVTHFAKMADFGAPPYAAYFEIDTEKQQNDEGIFYVYTAKRGGKTPDQYGETCHKWHGIVRNQNVKVDDSDLSENSNRHEDDSANQF